MVPRSLPHIAITLHHVHALAHFGVVAIAKRGTTWPHDYQPGSNIVLSFGEDELIGRILSVCRNEEDPNKNDYVISTQLS